jgi:hypothetical protein
MLSINQSYLIYLVNIFITSTYSLKCLYLYLFQLHIYYINKTQMYFNPHPTRSGSREWPLLARSTLIEKDTLTLFYPSYNTQVSFVLWKVLRTL